MTLDTAAFARDGLGVAVGAVLTGLAVYGYLWQLLVETNPAWGPVQGILGVSLFNLALFVGGIVIAYVAFVRGLSRAIAGASDTA